MVTLYAGDKPDAKSFLVHSSFAIHYSPVLKAAFGSDFIEGKTQEYRLDEESEETVRLLIHCRLLRDLPSSCRLYCFSAQVIILFHLR